MQITSFSPDYHADDLLGIDWQSLYQRGYRLVLLDIDNTLAAHGSAKPDAYAKEIVRKIKASGLEAVVLSNAAGDRAERFASELKIPGIGQAGKPSPKKILGKLAKLNCPKSDAIMIGDQLLTDVWAAKKAGICSVKVKPRFKKELFTVRLKRILEYLLQPFISLGDDLSKL